MHLSPREIDKLVLHQAGFVAQKRYARGLKLNYPETVALIATQLLEFIRDGESVAVLMNKGKQILGFNDVMNGVAALLHEVQVEGTFPDGTKLVTVHQPICREEGDPLLALYSSGLQKSATEVPAKYPMIEFPGEPIYSNSEIELNKGRDNFEIEVTNMGDRPVQVGSHYPFFETNPQLKFDREKAYACRLNIPSGTAVRFEPGITKSVSLIKVAGKGEVWGGNSLSEGKSDEVHKRRALVRAREQNFLGLEGVK